MGIGSKMQSFFCYKPEVTGGRARVSAHQAQAQQEQGRLNRISLDKDQPAPSRVVTSSLHNKKDDKALPKILLQSIFHAFQARNKPISPTEHLYASILHETPESKVMERMQQKSIERKQSCTEEEENAAATNEPCSTTDDATDALLNVQNKLQDIIQRLMRSYSIDAVEPQSSTNASSLAGEIGRGPSSWEHRVQSAIHRLSKIQELQASRS